MRVLVIGGGGREDALAWKLSRSPRCERLFIAPGNAGCERWGTLVPIAESQRNELLKFAVDNQIDLTVVGPEAPLTEGIVDLFQQAGKLIFGPTARAAAIEGSKSFAKELMRKHNIPTAEYRKFNSVEQAIEHFKACNFPRVIKADGLAAGKGVVIAHSSAEAVAAVERMMVRKEFGAAGAVIVSEEFLRGQEISLLAITDGRTILTLPPAQDHKAALDDDKGPNTGGMGAYSPVPVVTAEIHQKIESRVLVPAIHGMEKAERKFQGVLFCGLMLAHREPRVLEFNCRFGDPEIQTLLVRLKSDLLDILQATAEKKLDTLEGKIEWDPRPSVNVVLASGGYPGEYKKGYEIFGLEEAAAMPDVLVFHAGTTRRDTQILTNGGRVLNVTALGATIAEARERAYAAVAKLSFHGMQYRKDIAAKALEPTPK